MAKTEDQLFKKELRRVTLKACRSVEKMIREEPHTIVISDGSGGDSNGTVKEITGWLFHRSHSDDSERNTNSN